MKTTLRLSILFVAIAFLTSFTNPNTEWTLYKSFNGIEVYTKTADCNANNATKTNVIFKYVNTSNSAKTLNWKLNIWFGNTCRSCNLPSPNEYEFSLSFAPKETKTGDCSQVDDKRFVIFQADKDAKIQKMTKFEFVNVSVQ